MLTIYTYKIKLSQQNVSLGRFVFNQTFLEHILTNLKVKNTQYLRGRHYYTSSYLVDTGVSVTTVIT